MKKLFMLIAVVLCSATASFAQKVAYVDSETILNSIPAYLQVQKQIDNLSQQWQKEVDDKYADIEKMYQAYQNDQGRISEDMRKRREDQIVQQEKAVKDYQKQRFGYQGDLFQKRAELVKPIQDQVTNAIQKVASEQGIDLVLDKNNEANFLYANPVLDKTNDVLKKLGLKAVN